MVQGILTLFDVSGQTYASEAGAILRRRPSISGGMFSTRDPRKKHTGSLRIHARVRVSSMDSRVLHKLFSSERDWPLETERDENLVSIVRQRVEGEYLVA